MNHALRLALGLCALLFLVATVESFTCMKCDSGKCDTLEEEVCKAAEAGDPAPEQFIQRAEEDKFQCIIFKGKAKGGTDELTFRGCSADGTCTLFTDKLEEEGATCTPCKEEKCNSGHYIKPLLALPMMFFVSLIYLVTNQ